MGYYSQVALVIDPSHPAVTGAMLNDIEKALGIADASDPNGVRLYTGDWIKWYDEDPEVKAVEAAFDALDDATTREDTPYYFLRLGENDGDRDDRGKAELGSTFDISWTRHLTVGGSPL
jgi:hypothetical protein